MSGWKLLFGLLVRRGIDWFAAALAAHHMLAPSQAALLPVNDMTAAVVLAATSIAWSIYQKATAKWKFLAALQAPPTTTPGKIAAEATVTPVAEKLAAFVK